MKLLLTAFDPFGGATVNPAQEAVKLVANQIGTVQIIKCEVPTAFCHPVAMSTPDVVKFDRGVHDCPLNLSSFPYIIQIEELIVN